MVEELGQIGEWQGGEPEGGIFPVKNGWSGYALEILIITTKTSTHYRVGVAMKLMKKPRSTS
jgi:hypothetical protein